MENITLGEYIKVTGRNEGHQFPLKEEVQVVLIKQYKGQLIVKASDGFDSWWLNSTEFIKVD